MAEDCLNQCLGGCGASNYLQNIFKDNLLQELLKVSIGIEVCEEDQICRKCKDVLVKFLDFKKRCLKFLGNRSILNEFEEYIEESEFLTNEYNIKQEELSDDFLIIGETDNPECVQPSEIFVEEFQHNDLLDEEMKSESQEQHDEDPSFEALEDPDIETQEETPPKEVNKNNCKFCGKNYKSMNLLQRHKGKRHKDEMKKLRLSESNKKMTEWRKFRAQEKTRATIFDKILENQCLYCFEIFQTVKDLAQHKLLHITEVKPHHCPLINTCKATFSSRRGAELHYNEHKTKETKEEHEEIFKKALEEPVEELPVELTVSESAEPTPDEIIDSAEIREMTRKVFASKKMLDVYKDFNYKTSCEYCFKKFGTEKERKEHIVKHRTDDMPFVCPFEGCTETFRRREYLRHHYFKHTDVMKFTCIHENCEKTFYGRMNLKTHLETHTLIRRYMCTTCGHQSISQQNLRLHIRTHTNERPYKCEICGKAFKTRYPYTTHMRTHENDKRFVCDYCPVRFVTNSKKKLHERSHRGEKPYGCTMCEHKYTTKRHLRIHYRNVHELEVDMKSIPNYNNFKLSKVNTC